MCVDAARLPKLAILPLQRLDPLALIRRRARTHAGVALGPANPESRSVSPEQPNFAVIDANCEA